MWLCVMKHVMEDENCMCIVRGCMRGNEGVWCVMY